MKQLLPIAVAIILLLSSCEKDKSDQNSDPDQDANPANNIDPDIFFKIGTNLSYKYSDLELYDSSTHILGLSQQVSKDQLTQDNSRIWLGKIKASIKIVIN